MALRSSGAFLCVVGQGGRVHGYPSEVIVELEYPKVVLKHDASQMTPRPEWSKASKCNFQTQSKRPRKDQTTDKKSKFKTFLRIVFSTCDDGAL
jgi:hypothetical protein